MSILNKNVTNFTQHYIIQSTIYTYMWVKQLTFYIRRVGITNVRYLRLDKYVDDVVIIKAKKQFTYFLYYPIRSIRYKVWSSLLSRRRKLQHPNATTTNPHNFVTIQLICARCVCNCISHYYISKYKLIWCVSFVLQIYNIMIIKKCITQNQTRENVYIDLFFSFFFNLMW